MSELKERVNEVVIEGLLVDHTLEIKDITIEIESNGSKIKTACKEIKGDFIIETTPNSRHRVAVWQKSLKKDGGENKTYVGLVTAKNEFVTLVDALKKTNDDGSAYTEDQARASADKVGVYKGQLGRNEFAVPSGDYISYPVVKTNFIERVKDPTKYEPKATFHISGFVGGVKDENNKENIPTGRKILNLWVPVYGGKVIPLQFIPNDKTVGAVMSYYPSGVTAEFGGSIENLVIEKVVSEGGAENGGFGEASTKIVREYKNEFIITGGKQPITDPALALNPDDIRKAIADRKIAEEKSIADAKNKANAPKTGNKPATAPSQFDY